MAAIIATELDDLDWKDHLGDVPGYAFGNSSIGWAQITPRNIKRLHPDFGRWKRFSMAIHPETSIKLAAELIRTVADEGAKNSELRDFKCNAAPVHPPDFANDGTAWTEAMMTAAAYNYTQTEWLIKVDSLGQRDMVWHESAGGYGIGAMKHFHEFKGKFDN